MMHPSALLSNYRFNRQSQGGYVLFRLVPTAFQLSAALISANWLGTMYSCPTFTICLVLQRPFTAWHLMIAVS